jgi:hypothetical protein
LLIAAVALVALIAPLAKALAPGIALGYLVFYSLAGLAGLFALLVVASVCSLQFWQFILRKGGARIRNGSGFLESRADWRLCEKGSVLMITRRSIGNDL